MGGFFIAEESFGRGPVIVSFMHVSFGGLRREGAEVEGLWRRTRLGLGTPVDAWLLEDVVVEHTLYYRMNFQRESVSG